MLLLYYYVAIVEVYNEFWSKYFNFAALLSDSSLCIYFIFVYSTSA